MTDSEDIPNKLDLFAVPKEQAISEVAHMLVFFTFYLADNYPELKQITYSDDIVDDLPQAVDNFLGQYFKLHQH